jgi:hypothetical protein
MTTLARPPDTTTDLVDIRIKKNIPREIGVIGMEVLEKACLFHDLRRLIAFGGHGGGVAGVFSSDARASDSPSDRTSFFLIG